MPSLLGFTVGAARIAASTFDVRFTDLEGEPVGGGENQVVCRQTPEPGQGVVGEPIVLAIADVC